MHSARARAYRMLAAVLVSGVLCCALGIDLVANGNMSVRDSRTGGPAFWVRPDGTPPDTQMKVTLDSVWYHSPPYSMKLYAPVDHGALSRLIGQEIPLRSARYGVLLGKTLIVSVWGRDVGVPHVGFDVSLSSGYYDDVWHDLNWCWPYKVDIQNDDPNVPFRYTERSCVIDPKTQSLWIYAGLYKHGTAWIDDVRVTLEGSDIQVWPALERTPRVIDWSKMRFSDLRGRRVVPDAVSAGGLGDAGVFVVKQTGSSAPPFRRVMHVSTGR